MLGPLPFERMLIAQHASWPRRLEARHRARLRADDECLRAREEERVAMLGPTRPGVGLDAGPSAGEASQQGARRTFSSVFDAKPVPSTRSVMMSFSRSFTCAASRHHGRAERSHCGGQGGGR